MTSFDYNIQSSSSQMVGEEQPVVRQMVGCSQAVVVVVGAQQGVFYNPNESGGLEHTRMREAEKGGCGVLSAGCAELSEQRSNYLSPKGE